VDPGCRDVSTVRYVLFSSWMHFQVKYCHEYFISSVPVATRSHTTSLPCSVVGDTCVAMGAHGAGRHRGHGGGERGTVWHWGEFKLNYYSISC
jgi:hypothetical protein